MDSTTPAQLKPCPSPWCDHAGFVASTDNDLFYGRAYQVQCTQCAMGGPVKRTEAEAITAWNQRASLTPATDERLVELAKHTNWELTHGGWEDDEQVWKVHSVNGGRNDREWTLLGTGKTPAEAIDTALANREQSK